MNTNATMTCIPSTFWHDPDFVHALANLLTEYPSSHSFDAPCKYSEALLKEPKVAAKFPNPPIFSAQSFANYVTGLEDRSKEAFQISSLNRLKTPRLRELREHIIATIVRQIIDSYHLPPELKSTILKLGEKVRSTSPQHSYVENTSDESATMDNVQSPPQALLEVLDDDRRKRSRSTLAQNDDGHHMGQECKRHHNQKVKTLNEDEIKHILHMRMLHALQAADETETRALDELASKVERPEKTFHEKTEVEMAETLDRKVASNKFSKAYPW